MRIGADIFSPESQLDDIEIYDCVCSRGFLMDETAGSSLGATVGDITR